MGQKSQWKHFIPKMSIYISPLPKSMSINELMDFLNKIGPIRFYDASNPDGLFIQFWKSEFVDALMSKTDWLKDETLSVKRATDMAYFKDVARLKKLNKRKNPNITEEIIELERYITNIYNDVKSTFDNQVLGLINRIELNENELARYNVIPPHLARIFYPIFPQSRVYTFGSTITSLSFKGCDLDIYMNVGCNENGVPYTALYDKTEEEATFALFKKVKRVMYSMKSIFSNIISIPRARTPIIKFLYIPTKVSCDICFKNGLGVHKSNFLKYCAMRDTRIRHLMMFIKYWAKMHNLTGIGKISNYGLLCIIIFYLQQESVALIPPIIHCQINPASQFLDGWRIDFDENAIPPPTNTSSILELLHGFFDYFSKLRFESFVMCLLDGKLYPRNKFTRNAADLLPDYMHIYKEYVKKEHNKELEVHKPICVQDPIELSQNATANTPFRVLCDFQHYCAFYVQTCATNSTHEDFWLKLFMLRSFDSTSKKESDYFNVIKLNPKFLNVGLPKDFEISKNIVNKWQYKIDNWFNITSNLVKAILEQVLNLSVTIEINTKYNKVDIFSEAYTKNLQKIKLVCRGNKCVWYNRAKYNTTSLDVLLSALEKQAIVTRKILKEHDKSLFHNAIRFACTIERTEASTIQYRINECSTLDWRFTENFFILTGWLPDIIENTLLHMLQYKKTFTDLFCHEELR